MVAERQVGGQRAGDRTLRAVLQTQDARRAPLAVSPAVSTTAPAPPAAAAPRRGPPAPRPGVDASTSSSPSTATTDSGATSCGAAASSRTGRHAVRGGEPLQRRRRRPIPVRGSFLRSRLRGRRRDAYSIQHGRTLRSTHGGRAESGVDLRALLPYLRPHRARARRRSPLLSLLGTGGTLLQPLLTRAVLDAHRRQPARRPVRGRAGRRCSRSSPLLNASRDYLLQRTAEGVVLASRRRLAGHLLRLPIAEYDARRTGDLLSRVGADTTLLRAVITSGLLDTVAGVIMVDRRRRSPWSSWIR